MGIIIRYRYVQMVVKTDPCAYSEMKTSRRRELEERPESKSLLLVCPWMTSREREEKIPPLETRTSRPPRRLLRIETKRRSRPRLIPRRVVKQHQRLRTCPRTLQVAHQSKPANSKRRDQHFLETFSLFFKSYGRHCSS